MKSNGFLFVDLDGTLIKGDLLYEAIVALLKSNFLLLFLFPFYLLKGKAYLKHKVSVYLKLDPTLLPYNQSVLNYIKEEKQEGKKIILATASNKILANSLVSGLGLFDEVLASDENVNLKGKNKLNKIKEYLKEQGEEEFSYIGDNIADCKIFNECDIPVVVGNKRVYKLTKEKNEKSVFIAECAKLNFVNFFKLIRVHQWCKNLLIFIPLILSHKFGDQELLLNALTAFFSFSLLSSFVYIINDIVDLDSDRMHPTKKNRQLASGNVLISHALCVAVLFFVSSFVITIHLGKEFLEILSLYFVVTTLYSFVLKRIVLLDVLTLAFLYTIRIIAGGNPFNIYLSPWLFMFSLFIFFSLACAKRTSELLAVKNKLQTEIKGRGYRATDLEQMQIFGSSSGYIAILIFALYIQQGIPQGLYLHTKYLWFFCPLFLYWISRIWLIAHRGELNQDPLIFAIKDKISYIIFVLGIIILGVAKYV